MPRKSNKVICSHCQKIILEQLGAWIHADTGKTESHVPFDHPATPKSRKQNK
jgi:hypothetical protein